MIVERHFRALKRSLLLGSLSALLTTACASGGAPSLQDDSTSFSADWAQHTRPLFLLGRGLAADQNAWRVPENLPSGHYRLIERTEHGAHLLDQPRVEIEAGVWKRITLMVPIQYSNVEVLDERYLGNNAK